jgi:hypothetical protein
MKPVKKCPKCNLTKDCSLFAKSKRQFDGYQSYCKECKKEVNKIFWQNRCFKKPIHGTKFCTKCKADKSVNLFFASRRRGDGLASRCKPCAQEYCNKDSNERYLNNIQYRLAKILRSRLWWALQGQKKVGSAVKNLGCTITELKKHLERLFQPGMSWDNQGKWHIDHVRPLSSFDLTNIEQLAMACHYTNLQPLWAEDNLKKNNHWAG